MVNGEKIEYVDVKGAKPPKRPKYPSGTGFGFIDVLLIFVLAILIVAILSNILAKISAPYETPEERLSGLIADCNNRKGIAYQTSNLTMVCDIGCNRQFYEIEHYNATAINDTYTVHTERMIIC